MEVDWCEKETELPMDVPVLSRSEIPIKVNPDDQLLSRLAVLQKANGSWSYDQNFELLVSIPDGCFGEFPSNIEKDVIATIVAILVFQKKFGIF